MAIRRVGSSKLGRNNPIADAKRVLTLARQQARSSGAGGLPTATSIGQVLYSIDGATFTAQQPLTNSSGWMVSDAGILIVTG